MIQILFHGSLPTVKWYTQWVQRKSHYILLRKKCRDCQTLTGIIIVGKLLREWAAISDPFTGSLNVLCLSFSFCKMDTKMSFKAVMISLHLWKIWDLCMKSNNWMWYSKLMRSVCGTDTGISYLHSFVEIGLAVWLPTSNQISKLQTAGCDLAHTKRNTLITSSRFVVFPFSHISVVMQFSLKNHNLQLCFKVFILNYRTCVVLHFIFVSSRKLVYGSLWHFHYERSLTLSSYLEPKALALRYIWLHLSWNHHFMLENIVFIIKGKCSQKCIKMLRDTKEKYWNSILGTNVKIFKYAINCADPALFTEESFRLLKYFLFNERH